MRTGRRPTSSFAEFNRLRASFGPTSRSSPAGTLSTGKASASSANGCRRVSRGPRSAAGSMFGAKEIYRRRRHLHGRRQRGRKRDLGRSQGRREEHRSRRLGLVRSAPGGQLDGLQQAQANDRRRDTASELAAIPEARLFRDPEPFGHLPQGCGHADRRAPDVRRHVFLGQYHVRRRQRADPRDRHDAGAGLLSVRHPDQLPGRVASPLRARRRGRLAGDHSAQTP